MGLFSTEKIFGIKIRESADDGSDFSNPDADYRMLFLGEDGELHTKNSAGTVAGVGGAHGAWTSYTPTLTASSVNPTVGNGTLSGRYKSLDSKTVILQVSWIFGSTSSAGTGNYSFALPAGMTVGTLDQTLSAWLSDASPAANYIGTAVCIAGGTTITRAFIESTATTDTEAVDHNSPITWATGDKLVITGIIEIA